VHTAHAALKACTAPDDRLSSVAYVMQVLGSTQVINLPLPTGPNNLTANFTAQSVGGLLNPQTPLETQAGVTAVNQQYTSNPYDIRRYAGWNGNGTTDDSAAWISLTKVMALGGNGYVPPGPTFIANQVTFTLPSLVNNVLFGYGAQIYTTGNAIDGLRFSGGGNSDGMTVLGLTYNQTDALATNGFNIFAGSSVKLEDCACVVSTTVAPNAAFAGCAITPGSSAIYGYWNKVINFDVRATGGSNTIPYGIIVYGLGNATTIRDCKFSSVSYGVGLVSDAAGNLPNAVLIDGNHFEGASTGILINGSSIANTHIEGLRIVNNRVESMTSGFVLFDNLNNSLASGSNVPPYLAGNYLVSSAAGYISNNNVGAIIIECQSLDMGIVPAYAGTGSLVNNGPFKLQTWASTGNLDALILEVLSTGAGLTIGNTTTASLIQLQCKAGGGGLVNLPAGGVYEISGNTLLAGQATGYGTPTGGSRGALVPGTATLTQVNTLLNQLILDLKAGNMPAT
jgi:hypothetical protein